MTGSSLIIAGGAADVSIEGFDPSRDVLVIGGEPKNGPDWFSGATKEDNDLVLSWGGPSVRLVGHGNRISEFLSNRMFSSEESRLEEVSAAHLGPLTAFQRSVLQKQVAGDATSEYFLQFAPKPPEAATGYGQRLSYPEEKSSHGDDEDEGGDAPWAPPSREPQQPDRRRDEEVNDESDEEEAARSGSCMVVDGIFGGQNNWIADILRDYRENVLRRSKFGRAAITIYWRLSPIGVCLFANSPAARISGCAMLLPVALAAKFYLVCERAALQRCHP